MIIIINILYWYIPGIHLHYDTTINTTKKLDLIGNQKKNITEVCRVRPIDIKKTKTTGRGAI